jgi:hypothetical protein
LTAIMNMMMVGPNWSHSGVSDFTL